MLIALIAFGSLLIFLVFFLGGKKRTKVTSHPVEMYAKTLEDEVSFYRELNEDEKSLFLKKVTDFLSRIRIEGVGTVVEESDRVLVAASAIIPIFYFGGWEYRNISSVILYPDTFNPEFEFKGQERKILGMVGNGFLNGQMILSIAALRQGFKNSADGHNTAIHEFVHLIDKADGDIDGMPELLLRNSYAIPWIKAMRQEMRRLEKGKSDINPYALTNDAEFFAVASEYFFEKPDKMQRRYPELYQVLDKMFRPPADKG